VFTIVHRLRPIINSEGAVERLDNLGWYCWVHNQTERESYDTYKAIESLSKSGFQDKPVSQDVSVFVPAKEPQKKKRFR
jgi:hypothetical protein